MEVFYLNGSQGQLFSVYHAAARTRRPRQGLVYAPPFAEEMNRARRMAALQARRLAKLGVDVLLVDPFGTGDSAGDFSDARWETWREDIKTARDWLSARIGHKVGLWGTRLGALLAADVASADPGGVAGLVFWQPVLSGDRHLTQFLRLRIAASMNKGSDRESTKELRARLSRGEAIEVAGYRLAAALANILETLQLQSFVERLSKLQIHWLEVVSEDGGSLPSASQQLVDLLRQRACPLTAKTVFGEPFWAIQEITLAPNLLHATDDLFRA